MNYYSGDGTQGATTTVVVIGDLCYDSGTTKYQTRTLTIKDGLITSTGTLGAAQSLGACPI